jgi:Ca-activated chloride channel homolog
MRIGSMTVRMIRTVRGKLLGLALLLGVLAFIVFSESVTAQKTVKDLPPPPPVPRLKPTPTPKPPEEVLDVVKVTSNLVMVPVSVIDQQGQAVQGLTVNDFRLDEEGKKQEITELGNPEQVPLDIALLFDISSSVSQKGFFQFQQNAAAAFLRQVMKPVDKAAVFGISGEPLRLQALASKEEAATRILAIPPASSPVPTAFYDTVIAASKYLSDNSPSNHRRVIIVLTDGDDNFSERIRDLSIAEARASLKGDTTTRGALASLQAKHRLAVQDVQQAVQKADATFYAVNPGGPSVRMNVISMRAHTGMQSVADATGGTAFLPDSDKDLEKVFNQVAAELRGQYLLQYYGDSDAPAGQYRRIAVTLPTRNDLRVRARQGYYVKKK